MMLEELDGGSKLGGEKEGFFVDGEGSTGL